MASQSGLRFDLNCTIQKERWEPVVLARCDDAASPHGPLRWMFFDCDDEKFAQCFLMLVFMLGRVPHICVEHLLKSVGSRDRSCIVYICK